VVFPRLAGVADSAFFVQALLDDGVAVAPGSFFESDAHFRISIAGRTDHLEQGLRTLGARSRTQAD
jgi:aspartate/methionine/tyrosine aminotransferase